jgi:hypothetical protein
VLTTTIYGRFCEWLAIRFEPGGHRKVWCSTHHSSSILILVWCRGCTLV